MTHLQTIKTGVCLTALFSGSAALADVTAEQVWESWKSNFDIYGEAGVSIGSEEVSGGTVTVTDMTFSMDDGDTAIVGELGDLSFVENGDGTVSITMSEEYPITVNSSDGSTADIRVTNAGLSVTASGDPDAINYEIAADKYSVQLESVTENGQPVPADLLFAANNLTGVYTVTTGAVRNFAYALQVGSMDVLVDVTEPDTANTVLISGKINGLFFDANMDLPEGMAFDDPDNFDLTGFALAAKYGLSSGDYIFDIDDAGDQLTGSVSTGSADLDLAFDPDNFSYTALTRDINMDMVLPNVPINGMALPLTLSLAEYGVGLDMPLSKTEDPTDFSVGLNLTDLTVNEEIWAMGDPAGALPRDPATIKLDLSGTAKLFYDIMDPAQAEAMAMAEVPGELNSLKLNELLVSAVGAQLDGDGAFTFDNTDLTTIPDIPRPEGAVTVNLAGANKLIDTLIQMGLLPEDQAMGARMMMGMFATTVGDDQLSSTVEVNAEGHVIANGQRIR